MDDKKAPLEQVLLRLDARLLARIDREVERRRVALAGMTVSRQSVIRALLVERLAQVEGDASK